MRFALSILVVLCFSLSAHAITPKHLSDHWWPDGKKLTELPGSLAHESLIYAKISEAAYHRKMRIGDWYRVADIDYVSGFHASVYQEGDLSKKRNRFAIVFTGTDDLKDVIEDVIQATGSLSPQYMQAYQFAKRVIQRHSPEQFIVTGHSLGGGLASYVALKLGLKAYTFNPAGLVGAWKEILENSGGAVKADITHVVVEGLSGEKNVLLKAFMGPLGFLVDARGPDIIASYGKQPGRIYRINTPMRVGAADRHSIKVVIKSLEARWEREVAISNQQNYHIRKKVQLNKGDKHKTGNKDGGLLFRVTTDKYPESQNNNAACVAEFGPKYRLASWSDIVNYHRAGGGLDRLLKNIGMHEVYGVKGSKTLHVSHKNREKYSVDRHYFISRHDGRIPGNYLAHASIAKKKIALGSWRGARPALCYKK